jgi:hypothetical protein
MATPDPALICQKKKASQCMQSFALVYLCANAAVDLFGEQITQDEDRFV